MEAQRSGFHWERTSDGMSEPCPLGRGEGYEVREDEVGRFKEGRFQRGEADSPCQGEMSRRDKRGRVLEIPPTFDGSLVTFCPHRKWGPRRSPAQRVRWGEEEQGSVVTDTHTWVSGIQRTLRRRRPGAKHSLSSGLIQTSSPNRDHLLAPVIFTSRNCPTASLSPTTRTRRLPGVRAVRSQRESSLSPSTRQRTVLPT